MITTHNAEAVERAVKKKTATADAIRLVEGIKKLGAIRPDGSIDIERFEKIESVIQTYDSLIAKKK